MFNSEWLVYLDALNPDNPEQHLPVQLFADHRDVAGIKGRPKRRDPKPGWLRVELGSCAKGLAQVILPQPAVSAGETVVVPKDQIRQKVSE
jgi:hypothetical protein